MLLTGAGQIRKSDCRISRQEQREQQPRRAHLETACVHWVSAQSHGGNMNRDIVRFAAKSKKETAGILLIMFRGIQGEPTHFLA